MTTLANTRRLAKIWLRMRANKNSVAIHHNLRLLTTQFRRLCPHIMNYSERHSREYKTRYIHILSASSSLRSSKSALTVYVYVCVCAVCHSNYFTPTSMQKIYSKYIEKHFSLGLKSNMLFLRSHMT